MKNARPKATVISNKARYGYDIIKSIADYNPATFEDNANFSDFISLVEAFITTQSILQEGLTDDLKQSDEEEEASQNGVRKTVPETAGVSGAPAVTAGNDEWDF
jgi:hypothetical protein